VQQQQAPVQARVQQRAQVLVQQRAQVLVQQQVQVQQLRVRALVRPPLHQPLQSQFQRQRFRLRQHESR
jgi:hypothetical protein